MNSVKFSVSMRLKTIIAMATILMAGILSLYSQDNVLVLSLDDALQIAKEQSADALIAKHRFRSNYWQYRSFKADYMPSVNLDANLPYYSRSYRSVIQPDGTNKFQYNTLGNYSAGMSINQKVGLTGGTIFLRSALQRYDNIYDDSTSITYQSTPIIIGYTQPIFQYNEYRWAKQLEPLKYEKAKRQYLEDVEQVSITTINHYFNLLLAQIDNDSAKKGYYSSLRNYWLNYYQLRKMTLYDFIENKMLIFDFREIM